MKCACKHPDCRIEIRFDSISHTVLFERDDASIMAYLDPNTTVEFINELKKILGGFIKEDGR